MRTFLRYLPAGIALAVVFSLAAPWPVSADSDPAHRQSNASRPLPWPNGIIPYDISKLTKPQQTLALRAMQRWLDTGASIKFIPRTTEVEYVNFTGRTDAGNNTKRSPSSWSNALSTENVSENFFMVLGLKHGDAHLHNMLRGAERAAALAIGVGEPVEKVFIDAPEHALGSGRSQIFARIAHVEWRFGEVLPDWHQIGLEFGMQIGGYTIDATPMGLGKIMADATQGSPADGTTLG